MLWRAAVPNGSEELGGREAVAFLQRSGLDKSILKAIWSAANLRGGATLNVREFVIAMRLVALTQTDSLPQERVTRDLVIQTAQRYIPFPKIDGVFLQSASPPAAAPVASGGRYPAITPEDQHKYDTIFVASDTDHDGYMDGRSCVELFIKSGLEKPILSQIWKLSDIDGDTKLDKDEFSVAMHLVVGASKKGRPVPTGGLPAELVPVSKRSFFPHLFPPTQAPTHASIDDAFQIDISDAPLPNLEAEQRAAEQRAAEQRAAEQRAAEQRAAEQRAAEQRAAEQRAAEQRAAEQRAAEQRAAEQRAAEQRAAEQRAAEQRHALELQRATAAASAHAFSAAPSPAPHFSAQQQHSQSLDHSRSLTSLAQNDLKRAEAEKDSLFKSNEDLNAALAAEEAQRSAIIAKTAAVRTELDRARAAKEQSMSALAASKGRTGEAKGVLASLVAQLVQLTGRHDALTKDLSSVLEAVLGEQALAAQLQVKAATADGLAMAHAAVADVGEAEIRGLNSAISTLNERIAAAEATRSTLTSKLASAKDITSSAASNLKVSEAKLEQEQKRHERVVADRVSTYAAHQQATSRSIEAERSSILFGGSSNVETDGYLHTPSSSSVSAAQALSALPSSNQHAQQTPAIAAPLAAAVSLSSSSSSSFPVRAAASFAPAQLDDNDFGFSMAPSSSPPELPQKTALATTSASAFSLDSNVSTGSAAASGSSPEDDFSFGLSSPPAPATTLTTTKLEPTIHQEPHSVFVSSSSSSQSSLPVDDGFGSFSFDAGGAASVASASISNSSSVGFDDFAFGDDSSGISSTMTSSMSTLPTNKTSSTKIAAASSVQDDAWNF